jgi:hypothetical protein
MDESYAEVGTEVILGKHKRRTIHNGHAWCPDCMDGFVGKKAKITRVTRDSGGILICFVSRGPENHTWRVEDMILASDVPLLTPKQKQELKIEE